MQWYKNYATSFYAIAFLPIIYFFCVCWNGFLNYQTNQALTWKLDKTVDVYLASIVVVRYALHLIVLLV